MSTLREFREFVGLRGLPANAERCEKCNGFVSIGDFPFCKGNPEDHSPGSTGIEKALDYMDPHISPSGPVHITSRSQRRALMKANGLEELGVKRGMPGSHF